MFRFTPAMFILLVACGSPAPVERPESGAVTKDAQAEEEGSDWEVDSNQATQLFGNAAGVRVEVVPVRSKSDSSLKGRYLIRATRAHLPNDGLVVLALRENDGVHVAMLSSFRGAPFRFLMRPMAETRSWTFRGYDNSNPRTKVTLLEESFDAEELIRLRKEQRGSELRRIEPDTRAEREAAQNAAFDKRTVHIESVCGNKVGASIDWKGVPDSVFQERSMEHTCRPIADVLLAFCHENSAHAAAITKSLSLTCRYQGDPNTTEWSFREESPGHFVYTPGVDAAGQGMASGVVDIMHAKLRENLGETKQVLRIGTEHAILSYTDNEIRVHTQFGDSYYLAVEGANAFTSIINLPSGAVGARLVRGGHNPSLGKWTLECDDKVQPVEVLFGKERETILKNAKLEEEPLWKREPYFLARDSRGNYYYVDRYKSSLGGKRYRVFVGRRGQLKLTKLKRLVEDSEGTLFSTGSGDLRLVVSSGTKTAVWIRRGKHTALTTVSIRSNRKLIFEDFGVYYGEELGLVCD